MPQTRQRRLLVAQNALRSLGRSLTAVTIAFGLTVGLQDTAKATVYDWSYTDLGASGSGTLTTGNASGGGSLISGITGTFDGSAITGLGGGFLSNDILFSSSPLLDFGGLSFHATILGTPTTVELFYENQQQSFSSNAGYGFTTYPTAFEFCNDPGSCAAAGAFIEGIDLAARFGSGLSGQFDVVAATPLPAALPLMGTALGAAYFMLRRQRRGAAAQPGVTAG
jgi:hypothetical protein